MENLVISEFAVVDKYGVVLATVPASWVKVSIDGIMVKSPIFETIEFVEWDGVNIKCNVDGTLYAWAYESMVMKLS
jgi:hypothetical protein